MTDFRSRDLAAAGLVRLGARIRQFGDAKAEASAALSGDAIFDLQHLSLIAADGDEAVDFLQGQLTNDLREVTPTHAQASAWCSPKGRVLTCLLAFRHDGRLLLQLPESLLAQSLERLRMFVLRAKVALEDVSDSCMRMGLVGGQCESHLKKRFGALPESPDDVHACAGVTIIRLRGRRPRYEIVGSARALEPFWNLCREAATAAGADAWQLLDIEAGVASIEPGTSDAFVPQMINLDRIGAVNFTKGCYVGQEIVARTQHLGRIKRRMYRVHWNGAAALSAGDSLAVCADPAAPKAQVVNAARAPGGGFDVLAVIPIDVAASLSDSETALGDGTRLTLQDLPYTLDDGVD